MKLQSVSPVHNNRALRQGSGRSAVQTTVPVGKHINVTETLCFSVSLYLNCLLSSTFVPSHWSQMMKITDLTSAISFQQKNMQPHKVYLLLYCFIINRITHTISHCKIVRFQYLCLSRTEYFVHSDGNSLQCLPNCFGLCPHFQLRPQL